MKCKKVVSIISEYLDSGLPGHTRLELELHIEKCPACARRLEQMERMLANLRTMGSNASPVDCWAGVFERIRDCRPHSTPWYRLALRPAIAAPALAVPLIAFLVIAGMNFTDTKPQAKTAITVPEFNSYLTAHSHAQRMEPLSDPDVALVQAELEKASLTTVAVER